MLKDHFLHHSYKWFVRHRKDKTKKISFEDVEKKICSHPYCYLTGDKISFKKGTYHFDHIIPKSKGGDSTLDNLGLTTKEANMAKGDMTVDEFLALCKKVIRNFEKYERKMSKMIKNRKGRSSGINSFGVDWNTAARINRPAMKAFASGNLSKNDFYELFTYSSVGGQIRSMLRSQGADKSRSIVSRALSRLSTR